MDPRTEMRAIAFERWTSSPQSEKPCYVTDEAPGLRGPCDLARLPTAFGSKRFERLERGIEREAFLSGETPIRPKDPYSCTNPRTHRERRCAASRYAEVAEQIGLLNEQLAQLDKRMIKIESRPVALPPPVVTPPSRPSWWPF